MQHTPSDLSSPNLCVPVYCSAAMAASSSSARFQYLSLLPDLAFGAVTVVRSGATANRLTSLSAALLTGPAAAAAATGGGAVVGFVGLATGRLQTAAVLRSFRLRAICTR